MRPSSLHVQRRNRGSVLSGQAQIAPVRPSESTFMARLRSGDDAACEALVRTATSAMLAVAQRMLADQHEATAVVEEVFRTAFASPDGFEATSPPAAQRLRRTTASCIRRLSARPSLAAAPMESFLPTYGGDGHLTSPVRPWSRPTDAACRDGERSDLVRRRIDELPSDLRAVLLHCDVGGLDLPAAALALGSTTAIVKLQLHRARQALRTLLDPHCASGVV